MEIVEDSLSVLFRDGDPAFGLPLLPFECGEGVVRCNAFGDKRPEQAFQELEHTVKGIGTPSAAIIFFKDPCGVAGGEASAEPVGYAGLHTPSDEERQLRPIAADRVFPKVFLFLMDIFGGCLHNGNALLGSGVLSGQRVPAGVELAVRLTAEQGCIFQLFPAVLDAVAAYAHAFEFVVCRVKDVVADVHLLVPHHLCGSEINEWCCHDENVLRNYLMYI